MNDDKLARIRKLLAQAEDPAATAAEAEAFNAKAAELMARHGVDAALLAAGDPGRDVVGDLTVELLAPYAYEKASLGTAVARGLRCSAVLRKSTSRARADHLALHVFGHATDLVLTEMLLTSLLVQGTGELTRRRVPPGEHPAAYRRTWWLGFAPRSPPAWRRPRRWPPASRSRPSPPPVPRRPWCSLTGPPRRAVRGPGLPAPARGETALPIRRWGRRRPGGRPARRPGPHHQGHLHGAQAARLRGHRRGPAPRRPPS